MSDFVAQIRANMDLSKAKNELDSFLKNKYKVDVDFNQNGLNNFKKQFQSTKLKVKPTVDTSGLKNISREFQNVKNLANQISKTKIKIAGLDTSKNSNEIRVLSSQLKNMQSEYNKVSTSLNGKLNKNQLGDLDNTFKKASNEIERLDAKAKDFANTMKTSTKSFSKFDAITASNRTLNYLKNNTKAAKEFGSQLSDIADKQKRATSSDELAALNKEYRSITSQAQIEGKTGRSLATEFGSAAKRIGEFVGIYGILQRGVQTVSQMATEVLNVDNAMTQLRMATGASNQEASTLMKTYSQIGKDLKATGVDVATSSTEWLKQGKSKAESEILAKDSMVLSKIGDLTSAESTKYLTSAMKGYKVSVEDTLGVVDKLSAVDLISATSVGGLAEGMSEVANNADLAGISMDKLLGYLATVGEVTQEGMSTVGHSFSTIFSRMGNIKLARLKDYQNNGEDLSNVETVLRGEGIELRDGTDKFRNFGEVIDEVAGKWDSYSEVSQRAIASAFAGKNQMEEFLVLMSNYDKATEYQKASEGSSGQSLEKFEAYQESLAGKIEGFKNQFQDFSGTVMNSDMFKGVIESGTTVLDIFTQIAGLGDGAGLFGMIGGGIGITALVKNLD